jgi:L-serine dehydratase
MASADMALAGIESAIPFDEVVEAMYKIGKVMHVSLKETALGGLAATPTGQAMKCRLVDKK